MTNTLRDTYLHQIAEAKKAADAYYNGTDVDTESELTDEQYDLLVESLADLGEQNGWTEHVTLTEEVAAGSTKIPANEAVTHSVRMLSLRKAQNKADLDNFLTKLGYPDSAYIPEAKLDGLAMSVKYVDGKLVQVATRGDSHTGQDITRQATQAGTTILGLPKTIPFTGNLEVRGELLITKPEFQKAQAARLAGRTAEEQARRDASNKDYTGNPIFIKPYKNGRNGVSGAIQSKSGDDLKYMTLVFASYDAITEQDGSDLATEDSYLKRSEILGTFGFTPSYTILPEDIRNAATTYEAVTKFDTIRKEFDYPTDGIVIKLDSLQARADLGIGSRHPHWAIAYKYEAEIVKTTLNDISRDVGRSGAISYRAVLTPVEVSESLVGAATLNNSKFIAALDLRIGDTVLLRKANEIIPEIIGVDYTKRSLDSVAYEAPTTCPRCGHDLDTTSSIIWRCTNYDNCPGIQQAAIVYAVSRELLEIKGLSESYIEAMVNAGAIHDVTDLYHLTEEQISAIPRGKDENGNLLRNKGKIVDGVEQVGEIRVIGDTVAKTLYEAIQGSKEQPLNRIISSLGIRFTGRTFGLRFAKHFGDFDKIVNATVEQLQEVEGVKEKAVEIVAGFQRKAALIQKYREAGFTAIDNPAVNAAPAAASTKLTGQSVVVTGAVPGYGRNEVKELIESHGGRAGSSVSSKTTFLVAPADERETSKAKKATELGVPIFTPTEFLEFLNK